MCGIAGIYTFREKIDPEALNAPLGRMLDSIVHRGPDDEGSCADPGCALGMRRLSIIDIDTGNQPIFSPCGRWCIVYNGEIYNYRRLREDLVREGCVFRTRSDTEVLLQGWIRHGPRFLGRLEGMFAFAIYDRRDHELFIARDRIGKKPLYYYNDGERLYFCSETRALMTAGGLNLSVDRQAYWDFLTFRYVPGSRTAVTGIQKFRPGHSYRITTRGIESHQYWDLPKSSGIQHAGSPTDRFESLFGEAVEKRLVADVPVGVVLSGGIDSCAILYEASRHRPINSYHVFFRAGKSYNELPYARMMADASGSPLHVVEAGPERFNDMLDGISRITDEPLADLASIPFKMVCDLAARDVKVILSGEGSDEVLAGYGLHKGYLRWQALRIMQNAPGVFDLVGKAWARAIGRRPSVFDELGIPAENWPRLSHFNITYQADQPFKTRLNLNGELPLHDSARHLDRIYRTVRQEDPLNQMLQVIARDWLVENVLMKSDKVSMSSSLETRCPFLDHHLVEYVFSLPGPAKLGWFGGKFTSKVLLRRYLKGKIPDPILYRKKLGFPVPAYALAGDVYRDFLHDILSEAGCFYPALFDRRRVMNLFETACRQDPGSESDEKHFLWSMAVFELWYRNRRSDL